MKRQKILVPMDFSNCSTEAYRYALDLARSLGGEIELLHVWALPVLATTGDVLIAIPDQPYQAASTWVEKEAANSMAALIDSVSHPDVEVTSRLESGRAEEMIVARASEGAFDLIVMGTHGRSGISHLLLGSVAERVVRLAPCPVLTVKAQSPGAMSSV